MKHLLSSIILALLPILALAQNPTSPEEQYKLGTDYYEQQNYSQAINWFTKAAEQNHSKAEFYLGICYENGKEVKQDYQQAILWFQKAAEHGLEEAQCRLGSNYFNGIGVKQNYQQAAFWYRKAAEQDFSSAQCTLGYYYENGYGVEKDQEQAIVWYRKAASQGHRMAANNLKRLGITNFTVDRNNPTTPEEQYELGKKFYNVKDYEQAAYWIRLAAEQGYAAAQNSLGVCLQYGLGVTKDDEQAIYWFKKATKQGYTYGQGNLSQIYRNLTVVRKDYEQAIYWNKKADSAPDPYNTESSDEKYERADKYFSDKNYEQAVLWYQKAAEENHPVAQYYLGLCYENGLGVKQNHDQAVSWLQKAAEKDIKSAQGLLGKYYLEGNGVEKDYSKAYNFSKNAENPKISSSLYTLGVCYYYGYGIEQDYEKALSYFRKVDSNTPESADALYYEGDIYRYRRGMTDKNDINDKAFDGYATYSWFKAAQKGNLRSIEALKSVGYAISTGKVVDENNKPMYYVSVYHQNPDAASSTKTDINGNFVALVPYSKMRLHFVDNKHKDLVLKVKEGDNGIIQFKR